MKLFASALVAASAIATFIDGPVVTTADGDEVMKSTVGFFYFKNGEGEKAKLKGDVVMTYKMLGDFENDSTMGSPIVYYCANPKSESVVDCNVAEFSRAVEDGKEKVQVKFTNYKNMARNKAPITGARTGSPTDYFNQQGTTRRPTVAESIRDKGDYKTKPDWKWTDGSSGTPSLMPMFMHIRKGQGEILSYE